MLETQRQRIIAILKTLTPLSGTSLTVADYTPVSGDAYSGYFIRVFLGGDTRSILDTGSLRSVARWTIEVYSPSVGLGLRAQTESRIHQYVDAVTDLIDKSRLLPDPTTKKPLEGIVSAVAVATRVSAPIAYPQNSGVEYYVGEIVLSVESARSKRC